MPAVKSLHQQSARVNSCEIVLKYLPKPRQLSSFYLWLAIRSSSRKIGITVFERTQEPLRGIVLEWSRFPLYLLPPSHCLNDSENSPATREHGEMMVRLTQLTVVHGPEESSEFGVAASRENRSEYSSLLPDTNDGGMKTRSPQCTVSPGKRLNLGRMRCAGIAKCAKQACAVSNRNVRCQSSSQAQRCASDSWAR